VSRRLETVLDPLAAVFGVQAQHQEGVITVEDASGATIAMAAPLPGECERPCEIVTAPIAAGHREQLELLLAPARDLGFTVPAEAAVHLHVDAAPLRQPHTFAHLVQLFSYWRDQLRAEFRTNPRCQRLAPLPEAVLDLVSGVSGPLPARWDDLASAACGLGLTKFADINLTSLVMPRPDRDTVEIRCLPGSTEAAEVIEGAMLAERLLRRCQDPRPLPAPRAARRLQDLLAS
jgi:hypothetical protein